jgi:hypothetical protein
MTRSHDRLRLLCAITALLCVAVVVLAPEPAAAAKAPPWRWAKITGQLELPAESLAGEELTCPAGYIPISGGFHTQNGHVYRMREYPNRFTNNSYAWVLRNEAPIAVTATLTAWCAHAEDVGPIHVESQNFPESSNRAGGVATCPDGYGILSGGADWATVGQRSIEFMGPTPIGDGWFATGTSAATNDTLGIEITCLPNDALVSAETRVDTRQYPDGVLGGPQHNAYCPVGKRVLTGGSYARAMNSNAFDTVYRGRTYSTTQTATRWIAYPRLETAASFTAIALCVPLSTPVASMTQTPPSLSSASSGELAFTASDPADDRLTYHCFLDGFPVACQPDVAVPFGPLADGLHIFAVTVENGSEQSASTGHNWTIDTTRPAVATHVPASPAGLGAAFRVTFSEPVLGVDASTFRVFAGDSTVPLKGVVRRQDVDEQSGAAGGAYFRPAAHLIPGQRYTAKLSSAIHDPAGNALQPKSWQVRAVRAIENTSPAVVESWDPDRSSAASGDAYISSRTPGSHATLAFKASEGQSLSIWGMRIPQGGHAAVFLDGVKRGTASFYAASLRRSQVFTLNGLSAGDHLLEIRVLGTKPSASTGTWVGLDAVDVGTKVFQETALGQQFRRLRAAASSGGSYDIVPHVTGGDTGARPSYRMRFRGTRIRLFTTKTPQSGIARVYLDGVHKASVDLHANTTQHDVNFFEIPVADRVHEIIVVPAGTPTGSGAAVALDHLSID